MIDPRYTAGQVKFLLNVKKLFKCCNVFFLTKKNSCEGLPDITKLILLVQKQLI